MVAASNKNKFSTLQPTSFLISINPKVLGFCSVGGETDEQKVLPPNPSDENSYFWILAHQQTSTIVPDPWNASHHKTNHLFTVTSKPGKKKIQQKWILRPMVNRSFLGEGYTKQTEVLKNTFN